MGKASFRMHRGGSGTAMRKRWDVSLEDRNKQRLAARQMEANMDVRYEVSAVTTYKVTRMESSDSSGSILTVGEYDTEEMAKRAADLFQQAEQK